PPRLRHIGARSLLPTSAVTAPGSGRLLEGRAFDALALVVVTLFVAIFYWPARACGLLSDGWALLHVASKPLAEAVATRLSYHFIPGTHLLNGLLWRLLGAHDEAYQTVNLTELAL